MIRYNPDYRPSIRELIKVFGNLMQDPNKVTKLLLNVNTKELENNIKNIDDISN